MELNLDNMSELKYYKLSGKIDLLRFSIVFIIAIIASYLIGFLYLKMSEGFHFFYESIQNSNIQIHNNQIGFLASKLTNPRGIIALIVIVILFIVGPFLPFIISLLLMVGLIHLLREKGKSRNRNIDIISFVLLAFLCFIVSNK